MSTPATPAGRIPLTAILLLFELTRDYRMVLPLMFCVATAVFTAGFDLEITAAGATGAVAAVEISADHGRQILARKEIKGPHSRSNFCLPIEVNRFTEIEPRVIFNEGEVIFRGFSIADRE